MTTDMKSSNFWIRIFMVALIFSLFTPQFIKAAEPKTYGKPITGGIRVFIGGACKNPGYYWLPSGTTLIELLNLAGPQRYPREVEEGYTRITVIHDCNAQHFRLEEIRPGTKAALLILKNGDNVEIANPIT